MENRRWRGRFSLLDFRVECNDNVRNLPLKGMCLPRGSLHAYNGDFNHSTVLFVSKIIRVFIEEELQRIIARCQNVAIFNKRIIIESSIEDWYRGGENSLKSSSSSSSSLWRWRTASGLPRFQPLAVNNARTESVARSLRVCVCAHVTVPRRLIKQQLHTVDTQCLRLRPTYTHTRLCTRARIHRAKRNTRRNVLTDRRKLGTAVLCVLRVYTFRYAW